MKSKYTLLLCGLLTLFSLSINAQETVGKVYKPDMSKFDAYAKDAYGKAKVKNMSAMDRAKFRDIFENRLIISKLDKQPNQYTALKKTLVYNKQSEQKKDFDPKNFNPFNYNLNFWNRQAKEYYKVDDTGYYIILKKYKPSGY